MSYLAPGTPENVALAQHVNGRLRAEARIIAARAFLFRAGGLGLLLALGGIGLGAAFYGYAAMNDVRGASDKLAAALTTALSDVTLKTKGEVTLTDRTLRLENGPTAPVSDNRPSDAILKNQGKSEIDKSAVVQTEYTVFKAVEYLDRTVMTGWNFKGNSSKPDSQHCYIADLQPGTLGTNTFKHTTIAVDGKVLPQPIGSEYNFALVARNCVWFDASKK
ncbi:hypothetical protein [uncultured Methylobacterium sp.]|jgi:hypothetical protein|uniref:hypothetical protein n=1 Tax=uncultured Methylobacterium sp. TaxID=157278 RepID=UPI00262870FC|nr:hypothetical protein [uncultured Methylobacterium sp.]